MDLKELKEKFQNNQRKLAFEKHDAMCVDWMLEGRMSAYEELIDMLNECSDNIICESLKELTEEDIKNRGRLVVECYGDQNARFNTEQAISIFADGANWILNQVKFLHELPRINH